MLVSEPPTSLVLTWDITAEWQFDPKLNTEIEVRFVADAKQRTRVELDHRHLDRFRRADVAAEGVDQGQERPCLLKLLAALAE